MANQLRHFTLLILITWGVFVTGCRADPNQEFIQGTWYNNDAHLAGIAGETYLETTWTFGGDEFKMVACCFNEEYGYGNYRIVESSDTSLTLELYNVQGQVGGIVLPKNSSMQVIITIDKEKDTIAFGHQVFTRYEP
jgi:hypothetical protein